MKDESAVWILKGLSGVFEHQEFELNKGTFTVGRTSQNDMVIPDHNVSRTHVTFFLDQGALFLRDENSRNGTRINEKPLTPKKKYAVKPGDLIDMGPFLFVVDFKSKKLFPPIQKEEPDQSQRDDFATTTYLPPQKDMLKSGHPFVQRRMILYIAALGVVLLVYTQVFMPTEKSVATPRSVPEQPVSKPQTTTTLNQSEMDELKVRAKNAFQFQDYLAATELYEKLVLSKQTDEYTLSQYALAKKRLKKSIEKHLEFAKREYEKLNYERAIIEWKKVLSLSVKYDPEIHQQTQLKIIEAEKEIQKRR